MFIKVGGKLANSSLIKTIEVQGSNVVYYIHGDNAVIEQYPNSDEADNRLYEIAWLLDAQQVRDGILGSAINNWEVGG